MGEVKLLFEHAGDPSFATLEGYEAKGGYCALKKALKRERQQVIDEVKASGLRGRGGAGFPTWIKWNGIPKNKNLRHNVLCNADEGEPGTFKDKQLMEQCPHELVEGMIIAGYATQADVGYIYIRGEFVDAARSMRKAIDEARKAGYLGKNILGSKWDYEIHIHMGAGSYECGEESAMMSSVMGERGMPRLKFPHAPLPTIAGLWDTPTLINNVETFCCVPFILDRGGEWYATLGASTKNSRGTKIFSVSGHVNRPGNYEIEFGTPLKELLDLAGGMKGGKLKACVPGGSSVPILDAERTERAILGYEEMADVQSMVGSGGCMFLNEHTCIVTFIWRTAQFYARESCGKCTPCREGTRWLVQVLDRIRRGAGQPGDIDLLLDICSQIDGRSFCGLGDAAAWPVQGAIRVFREEFEHFIRTGRSLVETSEAIAMFPEPVAAPSA
ncbi:MAG: NADH-quinone oxidoreductase subunit F [Chthonomonadaceae bacterium]|uniref:NADH-quinone oxidoreductase subunit F n=1 Tax=Candidatus Nitrosymbiomonas proteolyticus TaxID=2608984 RepID=A0A809R745_9BACT|nr:NADH dehydrogenase [Candidatus Nitrosymbiomonas proteolyticus]